METGGLNVTGTFGIGDKIDKIFRRLSLAKPLLLMLPHVQLGGCQDLQVFFSGPPALYWCPGLLIRRCRPWHFPLLSFMRFPSAHFSSLWRFFWMLVQHTVFSVTHPSFVSSARHLKFLCGELPKVLSERVTLHIQLRGMNCYFELPVTSTDYVESQMTSYLVPDIELLYS